MGNTIPGNDVQNIETMPIDLSTMLTTLVSINDKFNIIMSSYLRNNHINIHDYGQDNIIKYAGFLFYKFNYNQDNGQVLVGTRVSVPDPIIGIAQRDPNPSNQIVELNTAQKGIDSGYYMVTALRSLIELLFIATNLFNDNGNPLVALDFNTDFMSILEHILDNKSFFTPQVHHKINNDKLHLYFTIPLDIKFLNIILENYPDNVNTNHRYEIFPRNYTDLINNRIMDYTIKKYNGNDPILDLVLLPITYNKLDISGVAIDDIYQFNKQVHKALVYDDTILSDERNQYYWDVEHHNPYTNVYNMIMDHAQIHNININDILVKNTFIIDNAQNLLTMVQINLENNANEDIQPNIQPGTFLLNFADEDKIQFIGSYQRIILTNKNISYILLTDVIAIGVGYLTPFVFIAVKDFKLKLNLNDQIRYTITQITKINNKINNNVNLIINATNVIKIQNPTYLDNIKYLKKTEYYLSYQLLHINMDTLKNRIPILQEEVDNIYAILLNHIQKSVDYRPKIDIIGYKDISRIELDDQLRDNTTIINFYDFTTKTKILPNKIFENEYKQQFYQSEYISKYIVNKNVQYTGNDNLITELEINPNTIAIIFHNGTEYYGTLSNISGHRNHHLNQITITALAVKLYENLHIDNSSLLISDHINIFDQNDMGEHTIMYKICNALYNKLKENLSYVVFIKKSLFDIKFIPPNVNKLESILTDNAIIGTGPLLRNIQYAMIEKISGKMFTKDIQFEIELICYYIMGRLLSKNPSKRISKYLQFRFNGNIVIYTAIEEDTGRIITKSSFNNIYNIEFINPFIDQPYWNSTEHTVLHGSRFKH